MDNFEEWLAFLTARLPQPVSQDTAPDGSIYFTGGEPAEVIVRLTRSTLTVWEYAITWDTPESSAVTPIRAGSVAWRNIPYAGAVAAVRSLIDAARESRLAKYSLCSHCEARKPPESMHDDDVCQACARRDLGVVY
jgi:hypothetical protein